MRRILGDRDFPIATYSLIGFNILLYLALIGTIREEIYREWALVPGRAGLLQMFTSTFLHASVPHLALNMLLLYLFGRRVERAVGSVEFFLFYIGSGFAASVMHLSIVFAFMPPEARLQHALGASGAIAGVMGVYAIRFYMDRFQIGPVCLPASIVLLGWLVTQVVLGIVGLYTPSLTIGWLRLDLSQVGYWAHLGGFIFGMGFAQLGQLGLEAQKEYLLSDAQDRFRRGTLLDVARDFEELLSVDPEDPFAYAELGRTWMLLGDPEQSLPYYEKALNLYLRENRRDLAVERLRELRAVWPELPLESRLQFRMGCVLEEMGEFGEAVRELDLLVRSGRRTAEAEIAALRIGEIQLTRLKRPDLAAQTFKRFLQTWPESDWRQFAEQSLGRATNERQAYD
jgi:membrane associated rhomboid family serine protease